MGSTYHASPSRQPLASASFHTNSSVKATCGPRTSRLEPSDHRYALMMALDTSWCASERTEMPASDGVACQKATSFLSASTSNSRCTKLMTNVSASSHSSLSVSMRITSSVSFSVAPMCCCVATLASSRLSSCHLPTAACASVTRSGTLASEALSGAR